MQGQGVREGSFVLLPQTRIRAHLATRELRADGPRPLRRHCRCSLLVPVSAPRRNGGEECGGEDLVENMLHSSLRWHAGCIEELGMRPSEICVLSGLTSFSIPTGSSCRSGVPLGMRCKARREEERELDGMRERGRRSRVPRGREAKGEGECQGEGEGEGRRSSMQG